MVQWYHDKYTSGIAERVRFLFYKNIFNYVNFGHGTSMDDLIGKKYYCA